MQEQIGHLLQPRIPPGWEEEVQERFAATGHVPGNVSIFLSQSFPHANHVHYPEEKLANGVSQDVGAVTQQGVRAFSEHSFLDEPENPKRN